MNGRIFQLVAAILVASTAVGQPVQIDVRSTGFEASSVSRYVARHSSWMPVLVELTTEGSQARQVSLQCITHDIDGDLVAYSESPIVLTPNAPPRRVWLYVLPGEQRGGRYPRVEVHNMDGETLTRSDELAFDPVSSDYQLILDISSRQLSALSILDAGGDYWGPQPQRKFNRNRCVARLPLENLPDRWFGLEAADIIVWDNPQVMPDAAQQQALVEWIERGGQLIVGIGSGWTMLESSRLAPLLPFEGDGQLIEVSALPRLSELVGDDADFDERGPFALTRVPTHRKSQVLFRETVEGKLEDVVATRTIGAGRITATTLSLRDLLSGQSESGLRRTLPLLLDLTPISDQFRETESGLVGITMTGRHAVRNEILFSTEFRSRASLLVLAAFIFVGAYVLFSTWISWGWLVSRKMTQASWLLFAICAIAASLLSVGAVQFIRGTSDAVHTFAMVDLQAGSSDAQANVWAGYRSGLAKELDLQLEGENSFIRAAIGTSEDATYTTPRRYTADVTKGILRDAPLRATLKQFQGHWEGSIEGAVRGQLVADRATGKLLPSSWIKNDTNRRFDLGYLLYLDPRLTTLDQVIARPGGPNSRTDYWGHESFPPAVNVLALPLGAMKPQTQVSEIGKLTYDAYDKKVVSWQQRDPTRRPKKEAPQLDTLWHLQNLLWANSFRRTAFGVSSIDPAAAAVMFYSTQQLYLHNNTLGSFEEPGEQITTSLLPRGDVTHWLHGGQEGQAVLLLYSSQPAEPRVVRNGTPVRPSRGAALYRVRIPIRWSN